MQASIVALAEGKQNVPMIGKRRPILPRFQISRNLSDSYKQFKGDKYNCILIRHRMGPRKK